MFLAKTELFQLQLMNKTRQQEHRLFTPTPLSEVKPATDSPVPVYERRTKKERLARTARRSVLDGPSARMYSARFLDDPSGRVEASVAVYRSY